MFSVRNQTARTTATSHQTAGADALACPCIGNEDSGGRGISIIQSGLAFAKAGAKV
jgi:hypothetical protein